MGHRSPDSPDGTLDLDPGGSHAREARRERLAAIGEIASEIAHELRNALQIVSANVFLARQNLAGSEPHLVKIERSARLAHQIVDDLMVLARGEPAHAEPVPLVDVLLLAREMLPDPGADFDDAVAPQDLEVRAHAGLVSRLLHALYENAIRASAPRRPTIVTRAARRDPPPDASDGAATRPVVVIEVTDDGPGVPPEIAATLFEPLVSARAGGTGLGLAMARRIADAHGGSIALVDAPVGAAFEVRLPA